MAIAITGQSAAHYGPLIDFGHIKFWSPSTLGRLLWETGFEDVEYAGAGRVPYLWKSMVLHARKPAADQFSLGGQPVATEALSLRSIVAETPTQVSCGLAEV